MDVVVTVEAVVGVAVLDKLGDVLDMWEDLVVVVKPVSCVVGGRAGGTVKMEVEAVGTASSVVAEDLLVDLDVDGRVVTGGNVTTPGVGGITMIAVMAVCVG